MKVLFIGQLLNVPDLSMQRSSQDLYVDNSVCHHAKMKLETKPNLLAHPVRAY